MHYFEIKNQKLSEEGATPPPDVLPPLGASAPRHLGARPPLLFLTNRTLIVMEFALQFSG